MSLRICLYARVSTTEQTLDPQWLELREAARTRGWTVVQEFSDIISGAKADRPGLKAMLELCASGSVQAVMAVKIDRLGRSLLNVVALIDTLERCGVAIVCPGQGIDTRADNPCGRMQYQILASVAEFERQIIRERTRAGLRAAVASGKKLGRPYRSDKPAQQTACAEWLEADRPGGVRGLAARMGVKSPTTAANLLKVYFPDA